MCQQMIIQIFLKRPHAQVQEFILKCTGCKSGFIFAVLTLTYLAECIESKSCLLLPSVTKRNLIILQRLAKPPCVTLGMVSPQLSLLKNRSALSIRSQGKKMISPELFKYELI